MEIIAISHKVEKRTIADFLRKLRTATDCSSADIIIGPDYSLGTPLITPQRKKQLYNRLKVASAKFSGIIIPGTISYPIGGEMVHVAPLFKQGELIREFLKERDNGEVTDAEEAGLTYKKGNNSENWFDYQGRRIAVEICGDHGNQNIRGCDLELILVYDDRAGFYVRPPYDFFPRKAVLCDGFSPKVAAFDYNPKREEKIKIISGTTRGFLTTFEI